MLIVFLTTSFRAYFQNKSVIWSEDFEGNWSNDWYADFGVWQVGTPTICPNGAHSGNNCLTVGLNNNYPQYFESSVLTN